MCNGWERHATSWARRRRGPKVIERCAAPSSALSAEPSLLDQDPKVGMRECNHPSDSRDCTTTRIERGQG